MMLHIDEENRNEAAEAGWSNVLQSNPERGSLMRLYWAPINTQKRHLNFCQFIKEQTQWWQKQRHTDKLLKLEHEEISKWLFLFITAVTWKSLNRFVKTVYNTTGSAVVVERVHIRPKQEKTAFTGQKVRSTGTGSLFVFAAAEDIWVEDQTTEIKPKFRIPGFIWSCVHFNTLNFILLLLCHFTQTYSQIITGCTESRQLGVGGWHTLALVYTCN